MVFMMSACGMKGDLYLPENAPQAKTQEDKAAQKQEKEKEKKPQDNEAQPAATSTEDSATIK